MTKKSYNCHFIITGKVKTVSLFKPKHVSFFQCFYCTCNDGANEGADFCVCIVQITTYKWKIRTGKEVQLNSVHGTGDVCLLTGYTCSARSA